MSESTETIREGEYEIKEVKTDPTALATIIGAEIDTQIATAKAYPRSLSAFQKKAMSLTTLNQEIAESCEYALPRGDKMITGPSIRLAEILFSTYGNARAGARVVMNDGRRVTSQGIFHDLETNTSVTIEVSRSIMQHEWKYDEKQKKRVKTGRMIQMNEDMQTMASNAASAIALRNAILRGIPKPFWVNIYEQARIVARGDAATLDTRRAKAIAYFVDKGIVLERILSVLNVTSVDEIDLEKLAILSSIKSAVANNEASLENLFPKNEPPATTGKKAEQETEDLLNKNNKKQNRTPNKNRAALDKLKKNLGDKPAESTGDQPEKTE